MTDHEHAIIKATLEIAYERIVDGILGVRNLALSPSVKRDLEAALREMLRVSPDIDLVTRAIQRAENYRYSGEELPRARTRLKVVRPELRYGIVRPKAKISKKKTAKGGRKPKHMKRKAKNAKRRPHYSTSGRRKTPGSGRTRLKSSGGQSKSRSRR